MWLQRSETSVRFLSVVASVLVALARPSDLRGTAVSWRSTLVEAGNRHQTQHLLQAFRLQSTTHTRISRSAHSIPELSSKYRFLRCKWPTMSSLAKRLRLHCCDPLAHRFFDSTFASQDFSDTMLISSLLSLRHPLFLTSPAFNSSIPPWFPSAGRPFSFPWSTVHYCPTASSN